MAHRRLQLFVLGPLAPGEPRLPRQRCDLHPRCSPALQQARQSHHCSHNLLLFYQDIPLRGVFRWGQLRDPLGTKLFKTATFHLVNPLVKGNQIRKDLIDVGEHFQRVKKGVRVAVKSRRNEQRTALERHHYFTFHHQYLSLNYGDSSICSSAGNLMKNLKCSLLLCLPSSWTGALS